MKPINSFHRGARAERQWAEQLTEAGFPARRTCQHFGAETPDVFSQSLGVFHWEVKCVERPNPFKFMAQAVRDAGGKTIPIVAMRRNGEKFLTVMRSADFLRLLAICDLSALSANERKAGA